MKPGTRLSSAVFQLTPTRTRCDFIIISNDKKEKIASGLLNPFLAHLKTAQDQNAKGGYTIFLEPEPNNDAAWFTKATLERFVRFVSTPEILERVYTIETQMIQIEEAIAIQNSNDIGRSTVEYHQGKPVGSFGGNESTPVSNEEKAIVLYEPGSQPSEAKGPFSQDGNSKVQLLKVLETRKIALRKEQGMAFARAVAAGFDIDHMAPLLAFAECFGASRLMEACSRFMELWKRKHENGQWLEIEAAEAISTRSDFSEVNASGAMLSSVPNKKNVSNHDMVLENNGKLVSDINADERLPADCPILNGQEKHVQGQFPHLMFPPWAVHAPPGAPPFVQAYPVQGMPYYQTYIGNGPFYHPPHPPMEHSPLNVGHPTGQKTQPIDGRDSNTNSEMWESDRITSQNVMEVSHSREAQKKAGRSVKNQSGMVVIRNINYITSKVKKSDSESSADSGTDIENEEFEADGLDVIHKKSLRHSTRKGSHLKSKYESNLIDEVSDSRKENDDGHWQAFQNCLLRGTDEGAHTSNEGMFAMEKNVKINRRANNVSHDPLALGGRDTVVIQDTRMNGIHKIGGSMSCRPKGCSDEFLLSRGNNDFRGYDDQMNMQFTETNGRRVSSKTMSDDFMIGSRGDQSNFGNSSEPLAVDGFVCAVNKMDRESSSGMADETFITSESISGEIRNQVNYEPDDLNLMPERGTEKRSNGYDPALDYEMQVCIEGSTSVEKRKKGVADVKGGLKKSDKDRRSKVTLDSQNKQRTGGPIRKEKSSKINPLEDARASAKQLRSFKADLQKLKKEKEEAELKRLEALKLERQKRIASRGSSTSAKSSVPSPQTKKLPTKLSPITNRGSKFSDSEPGSSSPLQRSKVRTSVGSSESQKAFKAGKVSEGSQFAGNRLSRSVSSLSEPKRDSNGVTLDSKASMARIRRLSEPKTISSHPVTSMKVRSAEAVSKRKPSVGTERNKISAIINLDKSKAATRPELKIKTEKAPIEIGQNKSVVKDILQLNGVKPSAFSLNAELNVKDCSIAHQSDVDDNPIIEKTIVMLEYEKPSISSLHSSEGKPRVRDQRLDDHGKGENSDVMSELTAIRVPTLPMDGVDTNSLPKRPQKPSNSNSVMINNKEKDPLKFADAITPEKTYQAPYARVSSLEDPCTRNTDYGKAPSASSEMASRVKETAKARVLDVKTLRLDKNLDSTQVKESSKGFRRLLKFGKKNHSSASVDYSVKSGGASIDGFDEGAHSRNTASSSEVHTLKNLISQEETPTVGNASQKSSRHFSLLPFWSKSSEKKLAS
ncbi:COP1-interacting protein-related [Abeliophyllum distichum]|uniref:COP1-interacting protein-related n=1 Tax=Abeliophyllum distichum TaxID=126358 RepID=A0ABD1Q0G6_9LAMI